ncbi:hypothetical protein [Nocardioides sp. B-3]|uniref:hypothetical protein n=1 Tax=Nocardioides sp. B-3 TaxID=2895565 RepID=UPI002152D6DB|nr:hypothetical protein [Nocardioides sp. B-3]UUZ58421.1 hypothetical protein LP418_19845 [Nocardioides sp. B-3]
MPDTQAAAARLVTLHNQCTGQTGYAGELDNDPLNDTDCKTASDRGTIVHAAELRVFTTAAKQTGGPGTTPPSRAPAPATSELTTTAPSPTTSTTGPSGTGTGAEQVATALKVRLVRALQTRANAAPKVIAKLVRADGELADVPGRFIIKLDGRTYAKVKASSLTLKRSITRRLAAGRHKVVVLFRPADRTAYEPARSRTLRITVRG